MGTHVARVAVWQGDPRRSRWKPKGGRVAPLGTRFSRLPHSSKPVGGREIRFIKRSQCCSAEVTVDVPAAGWVWRMSSGVTVATATADWSNASSSGSSPPSAAGWDDAAQIWGREQIPEVIAAPGAGGGGWRCGAHRVSSGRCRTPPSSPGARHTQILASLESSVSPAAWHRCAMAGGAGVVMDMLWVSPGLESKGILKTMTRALGLLLLSMFTGTQIWQSDCARADLRGFQGMYFMC